MANKKHQTLYQLKRRQAGFTQETAAEFLGMSPRNLQYIEAGKRQPKLSMAFRMADLYHCSVTDFRQDRAKKEQAF